MTLVGDGLPGSRQRETLRRGSPSPYSSGCVPRSPGNLGSHCAREASLQRQRCSPWSPIRGDPSAAVLRPRVATARPITFLTHLFLSCPIYMPRIRGYGSSSPPQSPPNGELPKASLAPKQNAQVTEEPLTCFPLCCLRLFPPPVHKPFQKGGEKGGGGTGSSAAPPSRLWLRGSRGNPAQLCAARRREKWALPVPARSPALGITGFCRD